jgi:serine/threonine protein kinase
MEQVLKRDCLGAVRLVDGGGDRRVVRDTDQASPGLRWIARRLARREAAALGALRHEPGFPALQTFDGRRLERSFVPGLPMHSAHAPDKRYFVDALKLLARLHRNGIAHNDLAKEANWIRRPDGRAGIVDFQLAVTSKRRGAVFRLLAREDLRHLLKHKRHYLPAALTSRQRALLARPSWAARAWRDIVKPPYNFVTRRLLGWPDRSGPIERA